MGRLRLVSIIIAALAMVLTSEGVMAQITIQLPGFNTHRKRTYRRKRVRKPSAFASHAKWYASMRQGVDVASNDEGVMISIDDQGDTIIVLALRNPTTREAGAKLPVEFFFDKRSYGVFYATQLEGRLVGISGADVIDLLGRFKKSRQMRIMVDGMVISTHLRGSSAAIKRIERAARTRRSFLMSSAGKEINDARVKYMIQRHKKKTETVVTQQVMANQQRDGVRPDNVSLDGSLRKENEPDIKVQYYVPGTKTIGEMWIDSDVVAQKGLVIKLNFVEPGHKYDQIAHTVELLPKSAENMAKLLAKGEKWTAIAKKNKVGLFQKSLGIVAGEEGGNDFVAVNFNSYEDASTSVQVEESIAGYPKRFNFAIHNGLELAAYLHEVVARSKQDFKSKRMSKEQKNDLFE